MTGILEFFLNNYILFLVGAIIILLAVIGYYADKTNFGQGTNTDNKVDENSIVDISNTGLMDFSQQMANQSSVNTVANQKINNQESAQVLELKDNSPDGFVDIMNIEMPTVNNENISNNVDSSSNNNTNKETNKEQNVVSELVISNNNVIPNSISIELGKIKNDIILNVAKQYEESSNFDQDEEEIKKFNDEFNSVLPKIELINSDLLSEIEDLELGKTQKLNLSDLTKLDDINLPRINNSAKEEHEIWKF